MASMSLQASLRTCKVDPGLANKVESDRFLNPNNMVCPIWNGHDTAGRQVCPDSFMTKSGGCNSAEDRVLVENTVTRPQYMEIIMDELALNAWGVEEPTVTGQFGLDTRFGNVIKNYRKSCGGRAQNYQAGMRGVHDSLHRKIDIASNGFESAMVDRKTGWIPMSNY